jgi:hypothetical protein
MQTPRSDVLGQPMKLFISTPVKRLGFKFPHALTLLSQDEVRGHSWAPPGPKLRARTRTLQQTETICKWGQTIAKGY